jgi:hypothetical protein
MTNEVTPSSVYSFWGALLPFEQEATSTAISWHVPSSVAMVARREPYEVASIFVQESAHRYVRRGELRPL